MNPINRLPHRILKPFSIFAKERGADQRIRGLNEAEGYRPYRLRYVSSLVFCIILLCAGCSRDPSLDGLVPAGGIVSLNGDPVGNAFLLLRPIEQGQSATATTNADGHFSLMTFTPEDGAKPGEYLVTVVKRETRGELRIERPNGTNQKIVHDSREIVNHLPEKYASFTTTDLQITIPKNGDTKLELSLTGEVDTTPKKAKDMKRHM